jgi:HSP20 family protein
MQLREEIGQLLDPFVRDWDGDSLGELTLPSTDISETDGEIEVKMDVPGLTAEELNIEVRGNVLEVRGEHKEEKEEKGKTFHRIERRQGRVYRSVTLPAEVNEKKVQADYRNGVLTISLPKTEEAKPHKIPVKG